ncbi:hypothetical protein BS50DRAFT_347325 [Corynespora cassiicola Philippines]|uniref:Uncharacterized protein n=1 Tax=Corynespora cassiicola Philippines TaxID=1448308 RepID=A0A2T2NR04_CORCC|nr:hypothetical protein BS50DRAFT_347325 [Corynespora cassiicola Philippines]
MPPYVPPYQEDEGESSEGDSVSVFSSNNHELELYRQSKPGIQNTFTPSDIPRHPKPSGDRHVPSAKRERIRDYRAPQDGNGKPLSSNIFIYGQAAEDLKANFIGAYQWPTSPGCDGPKTSRRNLLSITSARRWFDDSKHRVDITCSANLERWAAPMGSHTLWLHVERQKQTMEEFEAIASNIPELPENWKLLIRGAFKKFRDNPDFDAHVGWVCRADGIESDWIRDREAPPTVTCISIPYFFLGPKDDCESPGRSLYQWEDPKESSRQWDAYQSYPKMTDEKDSKSRIIYIRTIWALIAGHGI